MIDRASPMPLYYQLKQILLEQIKQGAWPPHTVIPTEKELQDRYNLSRTTVRQALTELVSEGYLYRQRGIGTFVAPPKLRHGPQGPFGLSAYLKAQGLEPGWRLLLAGETEASPKAAEALGLPEGARVFQIERLRLASGEVIGIHSVSLPLDLGRRLTKEDMHWGESSLDYIEGRLGLHISESFRTIEAVPANEREAELLGVELGSPILLVQRTVLDQEGRRIEFLKAAYRGDRFEYYLHFNHDANHGVVHTKFEGSDGGDSNPSA